MPATDIRTSYRRLTLLSLGTAFMAVMVLLVAQRWYYAREELANQMSSLANVIGTNASAALLFDDENAGKEILSALAHSPIVIEAGLYRKDGTPLVTYHDSATPPAAGRLQDVLATPGIVFSLRDICLAAPVRMHDQVVGTVALRATQDLLYLNVARFAFGFFLIATFAFVLSNLTTFRLRRRIDATEKLFDSFFSSSPVGLVMLDTQMHYLRINKTLADIDGASVEAHVGRTVGEIVPGLAAAIAPHHQRAIDTGRQVAAEFSGESQARPGETRHWLNTFFPLWGADNQAIGSGCVVLDITERKNAEIARREADARLRGVTDHLPVVLFQMETADDGDFRFTYLSEGVAELLGVASDRLLAEPGLFKSAIRGEDLADLVAHLAAVFPSGPAMPAPDDSFAWTGRFDRGPADEIWIEIRGGAAIEGRLACLIGVIQDVTRIKQYQDEIEQSRILLQQLISHREGLIDEEHKRIAAEIHDQLGQILTAALLHLRVLGRSITPGDKNAKELIGDIDALLNEAYRSMKDIAVSLRPAVLNFGFATAAEWLAERTLKNTGIKYHIDVEGSLSPLDERQATAFFRIVQESLTNCVRHADASNVRISLTAENGRLVLTIADDGQGLKTKPTGAGFQFGLPGIRERALALGGQAYIESIPGQGVTVRVVVPLAAAT